MRRIHLSRLLTSAISIVFLAALTVPTVSAAAQNAIPDRINTAVSDRSSVAIPNSVSPMARTATDLGPAPANTRLTGLSLRFTPSAAQQAALDQLLASQQDPASPLYRHWLTPQQYAAQFGLSSADLAKVTVWLTGQGLTVTGVAQGGSFVTFNGTIAQAQHAFSTSIHSLSLNGQSHFANVTNLSVPSALSGVVGDVTGLNDFHPSPRVHTSVVNPKFTSSITGNHYLAPGDIYVIYNMEPLLSNSVNGAGIKIAVTGQVDIETPDIVSFRSAAGLSTANIPTTVSEGGDPGTANNCTPSTSSSCSSPNVLDLQESTIDVEWSGAIAPAANILFVNGPDVFLNAMTQAVDQDLAPIVTTSYGNCEAAWGSSDLNTFNQLFKEANAQGQTILTPAGDLGATDCEVNTEAYAIEGLAVDFPGSSPYATSLGGTMFTEGNATGGTPYWLSSDTTFSAGAAVPAADVSAIQYIPEAAWNDVGYDGFGGGGGGASAFFAKPAWQVETGASGMTTQVPPDAARDVPDIALNASDYHDSYLFCVQGSCVNGFRDSNQNLNVAGGTSLDSQVFSGMLALVEQKNNIAKGLGNINPTLYALGNTVAYYNPTSSSVFHDVTSGSNAMPCTEGSVDCPTGGSIGYNAGTGFDLATGWGSVDVDNLANAWNLVTPEGVGSLGPNLSATNLSASTTSAVVTPSAPVTVTLTATVSGSAATPTGSVQFLVNNVAAAGTSLVALVPASAGTATATYQFTASCSTLGSQNISASYAGDTNYQGSIGPALSSSGAGTASSGATLTSPLIVMVSGATCSNFSLTAPTASFNVAAGGTVPPATITVAPANGFTGTVVFSATVASTSGYIPTLNFNPPSVNVVSSTPVSTTLTLVGIVAGLHLPAAPGKTAPATLLAQQAPTRSLPWSVAGSGVALASLLLLVLPRRRRLGGLLLLALSVALAVGVSGCGASSQPPPPSSSGTTTNNNGNPYAGTYTVTVTGTYTGSPSLPPQSTTLTYQVN